MFDFETRASDEHPDRNEDAAAFDDDGSWAVICDGVGQSSHSELAAKMTRDIFAQYAVHDNSVSIEQSLLGMTQAVHNAEMEVRSKCTNAQTTIVAIKIVYQDALPFVVGVSVGDSRLYLYRDETLVQISKDDSVIPSRISEVIDVEKNTEAMDDKARSAFLVRNLITQVIGQEDDTDIHTYSFPVQSGDKYILTSDGIHDNLVRSEIEDIVRMSRNISRDLVHTSYVHSKQKTIRSKPDDMTAISITSLVKNDG